MAIFLPLFFYKVFLLNFIVSRRNDKVCPGDGGFVYDLSQFCFKCVSQIPWRNAKGSQVYRLKRRASLNASIKLSVLYEKGCS